MTIENFLRKHFRAFFPPDSVPGFVKKYCKGKGLEIGAAAHHDFKINALNVDYTSHEEPGDVYYEEQMKYAGCVKKVDIIARGDNIPLEDSSVDFVFSSHSLEHFYDPVSAIDEWLRLVKPGKYVVMIIPHKERTFDSNKACTSIAEFEKKHKEYDKNAKYIDMHHSVWTTESFIEFAKHYNYNVIKVFNLVFSCYSNSFGVVIQKGRQSK